VTKSKELKMGFNNYGNNIVRDQVQIKHVYYY